MRLANRSLSVVMYHYIKEKKSNKFKNLKYLDYSNFKKQINSFKKIFNILSYEDFKEILKNKKFPIKPSILLTFDDGYSDHYKFAFPYLLKNNIKACFFSPTSIFSKNHFLEVNKIHIILDQFHNDDKLLKEIFSELKKFPKINTDQLLNNTLLEVKHSKNRFDAKKTILIKHLLQHSIPIKFRNQIVQKLFDKAKLKINSKDLENFYINKNCFLEMSKSGMHFGSHGHFHLKFDKLNLLESEKEIVTSIKKLKMLGLNNDIETMCYPYGNYDQKTIKLLKRYKIKHGFTTKPGSIYSNSKISHYEIPRYDTNDFKI